MKSTFSAGLLSVFPTATSIATPQEPVAIAEARKQLVNCPAQANKAEEIDDKKSALVNDILKMDSFPNFQFVYFGTYHAI